MKDHEVYALPDTLDNALKLINNFKKFGGAARIDKATLIFAELGGKYFSIIMEVLEDPEIVDYSEYFTCILTSNKFVLEDKVCVYKSIKNNVQYDNELMSFIDELIEITPFA